MTSATSPRLYSLDLFRGITVVLMIVVNSMNDQTGYASLRHAPWNGCTLADLVFPFFLFIAGASLAITLQKAKQRGVPSVSFIKAVFKRTLWLFLIGLLLNAFPNHLLDWSHLRYLGVLQRIALCFCLASLIYWQFKAVAQIGISLGILLGYWILLVYIPIPHQGTPNLLSAGNWSGYLDQLLIPVNHLYATWGDPEGILSTFPALVTTLLGAQYTTLLLTPKTTHRKCWQLFAISFGLMGLGFVWHIFLPWNKTLWTSSYVLWTGGLATAVLAACYWIIEIKNIRCWAKPLLLFGEFALFAFVVHVVWLKLQAQMAVYNSSGMRVSLQDYLTHYFFGHWSPENAALLYSLTLVMGCYGIVWLRSQYARMRSVHASILHAE